MPIYEYRCENGHSFEVIQSMSDGPVTACRECGAPVERVFHPIAVHFKGSGFYTTDYAKKGSANSSGAASESDSGSSKADSSSGSDKSESKSSDTGSKSGESSSKKSESATKASSS